MTRLPTRSEPEPESLDDLEELGDDAIIAQQTAAHAPQRRAVVSEESRSVVISDPAPARDTQAARGATFPKGAAEATVIIRDRRALDELRKQILERQARQNGQRSRALYVWGALGLVAFVLGGIVAFLATDARSDVPPSAGDTRVAAQVETPRAAPGPAPGGAVRAAPTLGATAVPLDQLPVESQMKK